MSYKMNGYNAYKETGVKTASQGKLVVMLYEAAVLKLNNAISLIGDNNFIKPENIENFGNSLQKAGDIITELQVSLDLDKGGDIAKNLMSLYVYFNKEILSVSISHDRKKLAFICDMMNQLKESWITASNSKANTESGNTDHPALNITL